MADPDHPDLAHFLAIPWCAKTLELPDWTSRAVWSRTSKPDTEDELFSRAINTPATISHMIVAYPKLQPGKSMSFTHGYVTLGIGLNGFPGVCHGGITALLIDEFQGMTLSAIRRREHELAVERGEVAKDAPYIPAMTGELSMRYFRPIKTPQTVLVVTRLSQMVGRKLYVNSEILNGDGLVLATGKGLFIQVKDPETMKL